MASSDNPSPRAAQILNIFIPFSDFFYLLQQEEYSGMRFLKRLPRFLFRRNFQVRDHLKFTRRVNLSLTFTVTLWAAGFFAAAAAVSFRLAWILVLAAVWLIAIPCFVLAGNWILAPYYGVMRRRVIRRAATIVARHGGLTVVSVAGSFGKTTVKYFLYQLARDHYATQMTPDNVNTPRGIAMWVNAYLKPGTQLLIVEMDASRRGDIAQSAAIAPADVAIVTNIGDRHLARFGSRAALAAALREAFLGAKPAARLLCTPETAERLVARGPGIGMREVVPVSMEAFAGMDDVVRGRFSASNQENLACAILAARQLGVPEQSIMDACRTMEVPEHRQCETNWYGYTAIDDSSAISPTIARAGLRAAAALAKREKKHLLVVTAGIPELGPRARAGNRRLGAVIAARADAAAILGSIFADDIAEGFAAAPAEHGRDASVVFKDLASLLACAHTEFPPEAWVVLVQPELTDLYY